MKTEIKISENQRKCLKYLADIYPNEESNYTFFRIIAKHTGLEEKKVRVYVRALARKGLAEYSRGLVDYDGMICGSGYAATYEGALLIYPCKECGKHLVDEIDEICYLCSKGIK